MGLPDFIRFSNVLLTVWPPLGFGQNAKCKPSQKCLLSVDEWHRVILWGPAAFGDFRARTTGSHVALRALNSGTESGRELFKGSKDAACLLVFTRKKIFLVGGCGFFVSDF